MAWAYLSPGYWWKVLKWGVFEKIRLFKAYVAIPPTDCVQKQFREEQPILNSYMFTGSPRPLLNS